MAFFPDHNPPDVEIHVRRTLDLASVGLDYGSLLRYGSHLPTPSQTFGQATAALGDAALIPYSPAPYFVYYALHLAGLDLRWAITVLNAALAMAVAPLCSRLPRSRVSTSGPPDGASLHCRPTLATFGAMSRSRAHSFAFRFTGPGLFQASGVAIVRCRSVQPRPPVPPRVAQTA